MSNELATQQEQQLNTIEKKDSLLSPANYKHYMTIATEFASSDLVPKDLKNKPANILIAMELGYQVGLSPLQSIQSIAVINGRPVMWGDDLIALVKAHPSYSGMEESFEGEGDNLKAVCTMYRKGEAPRTWEFSITDAKRANLWDKPGPWKQYPKRMLQVRARTFCARDVFPDALRGIKGREEVEDYQVIPAKKERANNMMDDLINKVKPTTYSEVEEGEIVNPDLPKNVCAETMEVITMLFAVKGVSEERQAKAIKNYACNELCELTEEEAQKLIETLNSFSDV